MTATGEAIGQWGAAGPQQAMLRRGARGGLLRCAPAAEVSEHQQRLLASLTLVVGVCAPLFGVLILPHWPHPSAPAGAGTVASGISGGLAGAIAYGLNRRGHYRWACHLFVLSLFVAPCLA